VDRFPRRTVLRRAIQVTFDGQLMRESSLRITVALLSAAADQLSQWRGYMIGAKRALKTA
jgi:hypothetical protein